MRVHLNIISGFASGLWVALIGLLAIPVYLRFLGIESFGLIGFLLTLQAWSFLLDMGLSPTISREMARFHGGQHSDQQIRDLFRSFETIYGLIALVLALVLFAIASWLSTEWLQLRTLTVEQATNALSLMAIMVSIQWMATLYRSALNGLQLQVWLGAITIISATTRAIFTLAVLAWISTSLNAFVLAQSGVLLGELILMRWYLNMNLPPVSGKFNINVLVSVWHFAIGVTAVTLLATMLTQIDKLLLARLLTLDEYGYFALAMTVVGALSIAIAPIFNAAYPRLAELVASGSQKKLSEDYHQLSQIAAMAIFPIAATLTVYAGDAVYAWTGDSVLTMSVAPIVSAWMIGSALNGLMHIPYALQLAVGWVRLPMILNIVAVSIMVPAILFFVPQFGVMVAGWIWAAVNLIYFTVGLVAMHRRVLPGELVRWYLRDVGQPCAVTLILLALSWGVHGQMGTLGRVESGAFVAIALFTSAIGALLATEVGRIWINMAWGKLLRSGFGK